MGFIKRVPGEVRYARVGHGEWRIHLERGKRSPLPAPLTGTKTERSLNGGLLKELIDRGVGASVARELVEDGSVGEERIREKVELYDWMIAQPGAKKPRSPGGWLTKAIREDYRPPTEFQTAGQRVAAQAEREESERRRREEKAAKEAAELREREESNLRYRGEIAAIEEYLAGLSSEEREAAILSAIANPANEIVRQQALAYHRDSRSRQGSRVYYECVLHTHFGPLVEACSVEASETR